MLRLCFQLWTFGEGYSVTFGCVLVKKEWKECILMYNGEVDCVVWGYVSVLFLFLHCENVSPLNFIRCNCFESKRATALFKKGHPFMAASRGCRHNSDLHIQRKYIWSLSVFQPWDLVYSSIYSHCLCCRSFNVLLFSPIWMCLKYFYLDDQYFLTLLSPSYHWLTGRLTILARNSN